LQLSLLVRPEGVEPSTCGWRQGVFAVIPSAWKVLKIWIFYFDVILLFPCFAVILLSNCCQNERGWNCFIEAQRSIQVGHEVGFPKAHFSIDSLSVVFYYDLRDKL